MIQRGLNKCGKKSSDPGMNKAQLYHYLRETFGVTKGGSTLHPPFVKMIQ